MFSQVLTPKNFFDFALLYLLIDNLIVFPQEKKKKNKK